MKKLILVVLSVAVGISVMSSMMLTSYAEEPSSTSSTESEVGALEEVKPHTITSKGEIA